MENISVGIIGAGNIAEHAHRAFSAIPHVTVTSLCARPSARRAEFYRQFNIGSVYDTLDELLALTPDDPGFVDALFIATPNFLHAK